MNLTELIQSVQPTVWGFVIGAIITMLGVVISNAAHARRQREQHSHERELEAVERDLSLRREVYLAAIEALSAAMVAVGRFGDFNVPYQELMHSYTSRAPAIAKVNIVGKKQTIVAVNNVVQELTATFLRLISKRQRLDMVQQRLVAIDQQLASLAGADDADHQEEADALRAEHEALDAQLAPLMMRLIHDSSAEHATLDRLLAPAISAMRAELGLPFDEALYVRVMEESHAKQTQYLAEVMQEMLAEAEAAE